ncbi:hypothetical protein [Streptomyces sp. enrichment culture]|uniref:hypothetical protein n=1 Tax=Streptomyces sp. enrichment culture TaxID=1795815 RepID=UPI003F556236
MPARAPLPPFPRWTGAHVTIGAPVALPTLHADGRRVLHAPVTVHLPRRARLWAAWRTLTRREVTTDGTA